MSVYSVHKVQSVADLFNDFRFTVKELLQQNFFLEETGISVEIVTTASSDATSSEANSDNDHMIQLRVRVLDNKKRKPQHKENEAIQFDYSIMNDLPEDVSAEMVSVILVFSSW